MTAPASSDAAAPVGIDPGATSAWIAGLGLGARLPLRFERIGKGLSNLTFLVSDAEGRSWVLRRPPLGELLASAHDIAREHRILSALMGTTVPVPGVVAFSEDEQPSSAPLLLMEHVEGLVIDSLAVAEGLPPDVRAAVGRALPAALAEIHAVDLEATGLAGLSRSETPYAARQIRRWRAQWEQSRTRELPAVDELADRLWAAMPAQRETCLLHGDFHLLNLIVAASDGSVRAILDWELSTLGDPLADLGTLLAYWPGSDEPAGPLTPFPSSTGFPTGAELAAEYAAASGRSVAEVGFWTTLGVWKVAIIAEGVLRRARDDGRNVGSAAVPTASQVELLLERGRTLAAAAGI